jgi:hypothetical protein
VFAHRGIEDVLHNESAQPMQPCTSSAKSRFCQLSVTAKAEANMASRRLDDTKNGVPIIASRYACKHLYHRIAQRHHLFPSDCGVATPRLMSPASLPRLGKPVASSRWRCNLAMSAKCPRTSHVIQHSQKLERQCKRLQRCKYETP